MTFVKTHRILLAAALLAVAVSGATAVAQNIDATLARMDVLAKGFRSVSADVHHVSYTFVIKDKTEQSGRLQLYRAKQHDTRMLMEYTKPESRAVSFADNKAQIYYPKRAEIEEYNLGKESHLVDEFLLLGFGSTSVELRHSYNIKYSEQATVDGIKADHLELTPKSREAKEQMSVIDLWIAQDGGYPVRLKLMRPSRDYDELTYSAVQVNPLSISEASVKLKTPRGVRKVNPTK